MPPYAACLANRAGLRAGARHGGGTLRCVILGHWRGLGCCEQLVRGCVCLHAHARPPGCCTPPHAGQLAHACPHGRPCRRSHRYAGFELGQRGQLQEIFDELKDPKAKRSAGAWHKLGSQRLRCVLNTQAIRGGDSIREVQGFQA